MALDSRHCRDCRARSSHCRVLGRRLRHTSPARGNALAGGGCLPRDGRDAHSHDLAITHGCCPVAPPGRRLALAHERCDAHGRRAGFAHDRRLALTHCTCHRHPGAPAPRGGLARRRRGPAARDGEDRIPQPALRDGGRIACAHRSAGRGLLRLGRRPHPALPARVPRLAARPALPATRGRLGRGHRGRLRARVHRRGAARGGLRDPRRRGPRGADRGADPRAVQSLRRGADGAPGGAGARGAGVRPPARRAGRVAQHLALPLHPDRPAAQYRVPRAYPGRADLGSRRRAPVRLHVALRDLPAGGHALPSARRHVLRRTGRPLQRHVQPADGPRLGRGERRPSSAGRGEYPGVVRLERGRHGALDPAR